MQQLIAVPNNKFDGYGWQDPTKVEAAAVLNRALRDEFNHQGEAKCTATLACFLEFRIAEALRQRDN